VVAGLVPQDARSIEAETRKQKTKTLNFLTRYPPNVKNLSHTQPIRLTPIVHSVRQAVNPPVLVDMIDDNRHAFVVAPESAAVKHPGV
jgi:hypothetical protein